jgi:hypothetical protein
MAGSVTVTTSRYTTGWTKYKLEWTSDAAGAVSGTTFGVKAGVLLQMEHVPGSAGDQPTDAYDVTILDTGSVDVLAGTGANLSNSTGAAVVPVISTYFRRTLDAGDLELRVANAGNVKKGTISLLVQ